MEGAIDIHVHSSPQEARTSKLSNSNTQPLDLHTSPTKPKNRSRRKATQLDDDDSAKRRCVSTACIACRRRKSKCDGNTPACAACSQVYNTECIYDPNSDHRRKGVYKNENDNLRTKDSTLQTLIQAILNYSEEDVPALVQDIRTCDSLDDVAERILAKENGVEIDEAVETTNSATPTFETNLYGKMGDLRFDEGVVRYIGGTSNLIHVNESDDASLNGEQYPQHDNAILSWTEATDDSDLIVHLLNMYFTWHYTYFTTLSKSLFFRDFELGKPPGDTKRPQYCSSLLVNAMLAIGCHFTAHPGARDDHEESATAGDHFFREAKRLLMEDDVLERPRLTTVQALALMSVREAGCGREAKGWVYSGMSFRMSQDMGLHLDSGSLTNNSSVSGDDAEEDARRITFWGGFLFDKCWSNYLGRLPQLSRSAVTTPKFEVFPDEDSAEWTPYTDSGFASAHSQPARTRAVALEISKLCEISNDLMQNFYNPIDMDKVKGKQSELKKLSDIHTRLESWRRELPKEFEPKEGGLSSVLVMHMFFQLLFVHLFRPFLKYTQATSPLPSNVSPRKLCTQAAATISKLLRLYKRSHGLRQICNIAVYIAHSACTIHLLNLPDKNARRDIIHGVKHLEEIAEGWLCARRSLGILSHLAARWDVELPYEAEIVLTRTDTKFGAYRRDEASPTAESKQLTGLGMREHNISELMTSNTDTTPYQGLLNQVNFPENSIYGVTAQQFAEDNSTGNAPLATQHQHIPSHISKLPASFATPRASEMSPSAMFGGIEQLLRDSQDWAYKDQAQFGTGFENWTSDDGPTAWTKTRLQENSRIDRLQDINNKLQPASSSETRGISTRTTTNTTGAYPATQRLESTSNIRHDLPALSSWTSDTTHTTNMISSMNMYNSMLDYDEDEWYA